MAGWKVFSKVHSALFKLSGGRIGSRLAGVDMVIIDTVGRKSGKIRPAPAAFYPYKNDIVVVASNSGAEKDPVWWLNLKANPKVNVRRGKECYAVIAEELQGAEREAIWPVILKTNPRQEGFAQLSSRVLPVIHLKRI